MWSLRRASFHLKNRELSLGAARICCGKSEIEKYCMENNNAGCVESQGKVFDGLLSSARSYSSFSGFSMPHFEVRTFSSDASAQSSGEEDDDVDDDFSELEVANDTIPEATSGDVDGSISESELSEEEDVAETELDEKRSTKMKAESGLFKAILASPSVNKALNKWVADGNKLTDTEIFPAMNNLRRRKMFLKALQMSEWLESTKHFEFSEHDYASRVDLIAKVRGIFEAENYIKKIPESFRGERVYRTLLAKCVHVGNLKKSNEVFNKMKSLELPLSVFTYNQLLLLYKKSDKKKIGEALQLMEKENLKPTVFTYQILIETKGQLKDIDGMEKILETMNAEGVEPSVPLKSSLARYYANCGLKDKAEAILKELEGDNLSTNRSVYPSLLCLYASIGKEDEVERIWKICESNPGVKECLAAVYAWGELDRIENAESAFEKMLKRTNRVCSKHFYSLLKVYTNHKMVEKGKELLKRMENSGCGAGPILWDALVRLYIGAGELEKAESVVEKVIKQGNGKPLFATYMVVLDNYAKRGDIHNSEKIFLRMKQVGYVAGFLQFKTLLQAYLNAKSPVYGFRDRMKADNLFPNKIMAKMLHQTQAFKKTTLSESLD